MLYSLRKFTKDEVAQQRMKIIMSSTPFFKNIFLDFVYI